MFYHADIISSGFLVNKKQEATDTKKILIFKEIER